MVTWQKVYIPTDYKKKMEEQSRKILKPKVVYRKVIPRANAIVGGFAGLIILIGIIESWVFFKLSLFEVLLVSLVLILFYTILLFFLLQPKLVKIIRKREVVENGNSDSMSKQIAKEIVSRPVVVNVNNQTTTETKRKRGRPKKKSSAKKR